jgi:hypothetical protein
MSQNIKFNPNSLEVQNVVAPPIPSRNNVPEWYKKIPIMLGENPSFDEDSSINNRTVKTCMPFWDSLTAGYVQNTWTELYLELKSDGDQHNIQLRYSTSPQIVSIRERAAIEIPQEFYPIEFIWQMPWIPETPKGYSCLIVHPLNQTNLPFYTLSGIIDSDNFTQSRSGGNLPFYIKKSFTGIIQIKTPMYQIIPIKRENWKSNIENYSEIKNKKNNFEIKKYFTNGYRKAMWVKKKYE